MGGTLFGQGVSESPNSGGSNRKRKSSAMVDPDPQPENVKFSFRLLKKITKDSFSILLKQSEAKPPSVDLKK